jgi:hypothetical protein
MTRRELLLVLVGTITAAGPLHAQQARPVLGFLGSRSSGEAATVVAAFRQTAAQAMLGYVLLFLGYPDRALAQSTAASSACGGGNGWGRGECRGEGQFDTHRDQPAHAFSSRLRSFKKRQSVPSAMIFCGLDLMKPTSCRRKA